MKVDQTFSKTSYKVWSNIIYLFGLLPFLIVFYLNDVGHISNSKFDLYVALIFTSLFFCDLVFGLVTGEMTSGVVVVKKKINPNTFMIRISFTVIAFVIGLLWLTRLLLN